MKQQILSALLVMVSLLGMLDAGFITYEKIIGATPSCIPPFQCGVVLDSPWAYIVGVPVSVYGLLFYLTMFTLAILNLAEVHIAVPITKNIRNTLYLLSVFGFGFSLYLISLMQFVIGAWCLWCLISAVTSSSLFAIAMLLKRSEKITASNEV